MKCLTIVKWSTLRAARQVLAARGRLRVLGEVRRWGYSWGPPGSHLVTDEYFVDVTWALHT